MTNQTIVLQLSKTLQTMLLTSYRTHCIEVPITNEKPKYYQVNDINTLIHNVTYTLNYGTNSTNKLLCITQLRYLHYYSIFTTPSLYDKLRYITKKLHLSLMSNPLLTLQNLEVFLHYHILQKISKL